MSYTPKVYRKQGGDELVVANGGKITIESGGSIENSGTTYVVTEPDDSYITVSGSDELTLGDDALALLVHNKRVRCTVSEINAGKTLISGVTGYKIRMIDCMAIAYGGSVGGTTTVDILGTQSSSSVKLVAYAQTNLTQSTVLRAGGTGATVLANGASFAECDADAGITIGKTGDDATTATGVDVIISYVLVAA
jgi:hypothetical protein